MYLFYLDTVITIFSTRCCRTDVRGLYEGGHFRTCVPTPGDG